MRKNKGYWTLERCVEEAKKYSSKIEFEKCSQSAYVTVIKNGWMKKCSEHMTTLGSRFKRLIYAFEFSDNHVYIGLTYNFNKRKNEHLNLRNKKTAVSEHIKYSGLIPKDRILTNYLDSNVASSKESEFIENYKSNGWIVLNKDKAGSLGGGIRKWNLDNVKLEALKYRTKNEFREKSSGAYFSALKNKWLDISCSHMPELKKQSGYWTFENCLNEALKYSTKNQWYKKSSGSYYSSLRNGWHDKCCLHMK